MELSDDQKKIIKFFALFIPTLIIVRGIFSLIKGTFEWDGFLVYACVVLLVGIVICTFYVLGSHQPKK